MSEVKKIVIVSLMRPSGATGVQTHVNTFTSYLDSISKPWQLVTPFNAPKAVLYFFLVLRRLLEHVSSSAAVWLYRKGHAWLLSIVLKPILKRNPESVIYAQCPVSANVALISRCSTSQKITLVVHFNVSQADEWAGKGMIAENGKLYKKIVSFEQRVIPQVDQLVFVSAYMQKQVQSRIPSTVNVNQQIIANFVADPSIQGSTIVVADLIAIGTLEPRKNQSYLLDIVAAANDLGVRLTLTLVGDGPDRAMLESKAKLLNINGQVDFRGYMPNASMLMPKHKALIHVAREESFGIVLIEAMSYGLPIFAPYVGGMTEIFKDDVHGKVISLTNLSETTNTIISTLENQMLISKYKKASHEHFLRNFDEKLLGSRLCEFVVNQVSQDK